MMGCDHVGTQVSYGCRFRITLVRWCRTNARLRSRWCAGVARKLVYDHVGTLVSDGCPLAITLVRGCCTEAALLSRWYAGVRPMLRCWVAVMLVRCCRT